MFSCFCSINVSAELFKRHNGEQRRTASPSGSWWDRAGPLGHGDSWRRAASLQTVPSLWRDAAHRWADDASWSGPHRSTIWSRSHVCSKELPAGPERTRGSAGQAQEHSGALRPAGGQQQHQLFWKCPRRSVFTPAFPLPTVRPPQFRTFHPGEHFLLRTTIWPFTFRGKNTTDVRQRWGSAS